MNCCLQKYTTYQFTYLIDVFIQGNFKYPRIMRIHQVHQNYQENKIEFWINLFSIYISFELHMNQVFR